VIVRLMGEGQWEVADDVRPHLDELDGATERAVEAADDAALRASLEALHDAVRSAGTQLDHDHLGASDLVVPPVDLSLDEARRLLAGDAIPDIPG